MLSFGMLTDHPRILWTSHPTAVTGQLVQSRRSVRIVQALVICVAYQVVDICSPVVAFIQNVV